VLLGVLVAPHVPLATPHALQARIIPKHHHRKLVEVNLQEAGGDRRQKGYPQEASCAKCMCQCEPGAKGRREQTAAQAPTLRRGVRKGEELRRGRHGNLVPKVKWRCGRPSRTAPRPCSSEDPVSGFQRARTIACFDQGSSSAWASTDTHRASLGKHLGKH